MKKQPEAKKGVGKWILIIVVIVVLFIVSIIIAGIIVALFSGGVSVGIGNTALIPVKGVIVSESSDFIFGAENAVSTEIIEKIEKADSDPMIKAILFEINSPGGQPVATDEIAQAIKNTNKTTVAWIRDAGASGAYWIASATDYIVAHRMSITGSVGVTASYLQFSGLLEKYNLTYQSLATGEYKEIGSPFKNLTDTERVLLMKQLEIIHQYFIDEVAANRNLPQDVIENISTGMFYLGAQAKDLYLVDELGGKQEALDYIEKQINKTPKLVSYEKKKGFLEMLAGTLSEQSFFMGKAFREGIISREMEIKT